MLHPLTKLNTLFYLSRFHKRDKCTSFFCILSYQLYFGINYKVSKCYDTPFTLQNDTSLIRKNGIKKRKDIEERTKQHQNLTAERLNYIISHKILQSIIYIRVIHLKHHKLDSYKDLPSHYNLITI